jgi:MYXO-CTERM domain-containing protein
VLPVKPGARIELSQDAWIASLDASTQVVIQGPSPSCGGGVPVDYAGRGGGGCSFGASSSDNAPAAAFGAAEADASAGGQAVQVVSESVVGPYDAVTVRSSQGEALGAWLNANGYDVPASIQPTIDAFTAQGFDFIALKLAPGEGVQAMQPVRVITPGADPSLPLRMVAAGVGAKVGIELFVLSEGRYHPQNFPDATIDFSQLAWDPYQSRSNYSELAQAAMAAGAGNGWLTESAQSVALFGGSNGYNPALASVYQQTCRPLTLPPPPSCGGSGSGSSGDAGGTMSSEAGASGGGTEGGVMEAGVSDGGASDGTDAAPDAGDDDGGACAPTVVGCDDLNLAMTGITVGDLWVTRLRANLPANALANDLVLEAAPSQQPVNSVHTTSTYTDPNYNPCPKTSSATSSGSSSSSGCACRTAESSPRDRYADVIAMGLGAVGLALSLRRRRRR